MPLWSRYLAAIVLLSPAVSTAQTPAYTFTPESLLDNQCIDNPPIGDGFGWDGICTCIPNPADIPYEWTSTTLVAGQLIASTANAPGTCSESGSLSIYEWRVDQPPVKTQELISGIRDSRDRFGVGSSVVVTDGLIASRSSVSESFVTIFRRNEERWSQEILLNPVGVNRGGFGSNMTFLDETTLLIDEDDALVIYDASDWNTPQLIPIEAQRIWSLEKAGEGFVVYRALTNDAAESARTDYFIREGSQYTLQQTLNDFFTSVSDNLMVSLRDETLVTRELDSSGMWVELPAATMEIEFARFATTVNLVDSQLVITNEDNLQIFNLSDSRAWSLSQQINFEIFEGPCGLGRCNRISTSIDDSKIIVQNFNFEFDTIPVTHTVFERNSGGMWTELTTITVADSDEATGGFFAPNRHFSIIDNYALAEIPNGPVDRSTLAVFNLGAAQSAAEEPGETGSNESDDNTISNGETSLDVATDNTSNPGSGVLEGDSNATDGSALADNQPVDNDVVDTGNDATDTATNPDSDITSIAPDSGGGATGPFALLLIMLLIRNRRCARRSPILDSND